MDITLFFPFSFLLKFCIAWSICYLVPSQGIIWLWNMLYLCCIIFYLDQPFFPSLSQAICFLRERDSDGDGKVNFKEFFHGLFDLVRNYDEDSDNSSHPSGDLMETPAKNMFSRLDKDGDGYSSNLLGYITFLLDGKAICYFGFWCQYLYLAFVLNRYLSDIELLPIIDKLHPSERYYAKQQADYIISQVLLLQGFLCFSLSFFFVFDKELSLL